MRLLILCWLAVLITGCATKTPKESAKFLLKVKSDMGYESIERKVASLVFNEREKVLFSDKDKQEVTVRLVRTCIPDSIGKVSVVYDVTVKKDLDSIHFDFSAIGGRNDFIRLTAYDSTSKKYSYTPHLLCSVEQARAAAVGIKREIAGEK